MCTVTFCLLVTVAILLLCLSVLAIYVYIETMNCGKLSSMSLQNPKLVLLCIEMAE